jgi:hypothetical protein
MKRSKIFLGITTGILAVVAFTAAKTAKFTAKVAAYYSDGVGPNHACTVTANASYYTATDRSGSQGVVNSHLVFTRDASGCVSRLYVGTTE